MLLRRRSFLAAMAAAIPAAARTSAAPEIDYAPVNGLKLYYEIHGAGRPLILLHGGLGECPPRHSAGPDPLHNLLVTRPANRSYALSRPTQSE